LTRKLGDTHIVDTTYKLLTRKLGDTQIVDMAHN
jgi:hypothetical protein